MAIPILHLKEFDSVAPDVVKTTIDALRQGKLVVFPTETVYGLGALASQEKAVERLIQAKGRKSGHALPIAISGASSLSKYVSHLDEIGDRLARRCWPGPVTLVLDSESPSSWLRQLSPLVQKAIMPTFSVGYRVPNHPVFLEILRQLDEPVVLTSANLTGEPPATTADMAKVGLGDKPDLLLDGGPAYYQKPSTVVHIHDDQWHILREGTVSRENIKRLVAKIILFVCTGNTCRSPMAEMLCSKILAEQLHCRVEELEEKGYVIMSAGVATIHGSSASEGSKEAIRSYGLSLDSYQSQPLCESLIRFADKIYVMGRAHREAILSQWPEADSRLFVLSTNHDDISDPLGSDVTVYRQCAEQIEMEIRKRIPEIL